MFLPELKAINNGHPLLFCFFFVGASSSEAASSFAACSSFEASNCEDDVTARGNQHSVTSSPEEIWSATNCLQNLHVHVPSHEHAARYKVQGLVDLFTPAPPFPDVFFLFAPICLHS
jgi:hypothetical protein